MPVLLLIYGILVFLTTITCLYVAFFTWDTPLQHRIDLATLYAPYAGIGELPYYLALPGDLIVGGEEA